MLRPVAYEAFDVGQRGLHILHRVPLEAAVEVVAAGEDVGRRQTHLREPRAVGTAAHQFLDQLDAHLLGRREGEADGPRIRLLNVVAHVAVVVGDLESDLGARVARRRGVHQLPKETLTPLKASAREVTQQEVHLGTGDVAAHLVGAEVALALARCLRRLVGG